MNQLHVYVFGKLRMRYGQKEVVSFPTRHAEELLGYLVLHPGVHHSREKLIDILWPYCAQSNARGRFSTVLWRLRAMFEQIGASADDYLQASRDWVTFSPAQPVTVDAHEFEALLNKSTQEESDSRQEETLRTAVAFYQGEFCEGIYADWCLLERERLARYYLRVMGQLMACLLQRRLYTEAVVLGRELLQYDPLREEVHRAIMYCYWQMDQPVQAMRQFQICSQLLKDELQALPMPETVTLYRQIVTGRLTSARIGVAQPEAVRAKLQMAFHEFQKAGDRLSQLLEAVEM